MDKFLNYKQKYLQFKELIGGEIYLGVDNNNPPRYILYANREDSIKFKNITQEDLETMKDQWNVLHSEDIINNIELNIINTVENKRNVRIIMNDIELYNPVLERLLKQFFLEKIQQIPVLPLLEAKSELETIFHSWHSINHERLYDNVNSKITIPEELYNEFIEIIYNYINDIIRETAN